MASIASIPDILTNLATLTASLPSSVALGTRSDKFYHVLTNINEGDPFETFNRRFDILFKEDDDCRDAAGRLHYIRRGEYGMDLLCKYLQGIDWTAGMDIPAVRIKLDRVVEEVVYLV